MALSESITFRAEDENSIVSQIIAKRIIRVLMLAKS
jgi:hypothetical protein